MERSIVNPRTQKKYKYVGLGNHCFVLALNVNDNSLHTILNGDPGTSAEGLTLKQTDLYSTMCFFFSHFLHINSATNIISTESGWDGIQTLRPKHGEFFCGPAMGPEYLHRSATSINYCTLYKINIDPTTNEINQQEPIHSALTFMPIDRNYPGAIKYIYVDAYCANRRIGAKGAGVLLDAIVDLAAYMDYDEIRLSALPDAIDFYTKRRFAEHGKTVNLTDMTRELSDSMSGTRFQSASPSVDQDTIFEESFEDIDNSSPSEKIKTPSVDKVGYKNATNGKLDMISLSVPPELKQIQTAVPEPDSPSNYASQQVGNMNFNIFQPHTITRSGREVRFPFQMVLNYNISIPKKRFRKSRKHHTVKVKKHPRTRPSKQPHKQSRKHTRKTTAV